jgi:hypothetical protein
MPLPLIATLAGKALMSKIPGMIGEVNASGAASAGIGGAMNNPGNIMEMMNKALATPVNEEEDPTAVNKGVPVQNQPTDTPAQTMGNPLPGAAQMPTVDNPSVSTPTNPTGAPANEASGSANNPISSILGTMSANNGQYQTDERGVTQVTESSDIVGDALGKASKGDLLGAGLAVVSGMTNQQSQVRRQGREEEQWNSEMERQMKRSSAYNDPNSVYYAAKNGASINPSNPPLWHQNNNLTSMMGSGDGYKKGGKMKVKC